MSQNRPYRTQQGRSFNGRFEPTSDLWRSLTTQPLRDVVRLGAPALGWLADLAGLRPALTITSALAFVVVLSILPAMRRRKQEMQADPP
jgi:hypothetical protein